MRVKLRTTILLLLLAANASLASSPSVVLEKHRVVIQVNGVVCSFCAYGAEKALAELDCLDKAEFGDGVLIDIDTHRITLAMRPGEAIPFRDIYQRIKKSGYDPITLHLQSEGTLQRSAETLLLRDASSGQLFRVVGAELAGVADDATVSVQAHWVASQLPALAESDVVELTIDRLISISD